MISDISKTILFRFTNRFTKKEIFTVKMPYLPFFAIDGYYSQAYKRHKESAAQYFEKSMVIGKKWLITEKTSRIIISLPNGFALDMPYDVTEKDLGIIKHYLEGLKMAFD